MNTPPRPAPARFPQPLDQWELRLVLAIAVQVVLTCVIAATGMPVGDAFGVLLVSTLVASVALRPLAAAGLGVATWFLFDGFVVNSLGQITIDTSGIRLLAVIVAVGTGLAALRVAHANRMERNR